MFAKTEKAPRKTELDMVVERNRAAVNELIGMIKGAGKEISSLFGSDETQKKEPTNQ